MKELHFAAGERDISTGRKAADDVVIGRALRRVEKIDVLIVQKVRVGGDAEQAAIAAAVDCKTDKGRIQQSAVFENPYPPGLLTDENTPIRGNLHRDGAEQSAGKLRFREALGQIGRM